MIKEAISKIIKNQDLTEAEMMAVMDEIMRGLASPAQIGSFLTALRLKGETVDEITGAARVMRKKVLKITPPPGRVVDTCGTGGDEANTFNISTVSAFVAAGAGVTVAKHGNRSVSSKCGSADLLMALGVNIEAGIDRVERCLMEIGIGFLFAPLFHKAMKNVAGPRREIGIRTIFNILGPLTNPASADCQVLGVYDDILTDLLAKVLYKLGSKHAFVVRGEDGLDEFTLTRETKVTELKDGEIRSYYLFPEALGLERCKPSELLGGTPEVNAEIARDILKGKKGPKRDVVLLNASAAIVAGGLAEDLKEGLKIAQESIDSGKAMEKLEGLIELTN